MSAAHHHFNQFLPFFLLVLIPLHAMETNPSATVLTQFFDAIKTCDVQTIHTILKNHPTVVHKISLIGTTALEEAIHIDMHSTDTNARRPLLVKLLLKAGAHIKKTYLTHLLTDIQGNTTCKNQIAHLLFSFGAAMDSNNDQYYTNDPESILRIWEREDRFKEINNKKLIIITQKHICTRLYIAIQEGDANEVYRLVRKYNLAINKPLPCYFLRLDYGTPSALVDIPSTEIIPLHYARACRQDAIVRILVDDLHAIDSIHSMPTDENSEETNSIDCTYANESSSQEIEDHVKSDEIEIAKNFHTPDINFEEPPLVPDNLNTITSNNYDKSKPDPVDDPPHVITNGSLPWKWIGGGFAVIVVIISAKKIYNWWHTTPELQKEESAESEPQSNKQPLLDVRVLKNTV